MDSRQVTWFVEGAMMEYYRRNEWNPKDYENYTQESINKVWRYLTQPSITIDGSYTDIQAHIALEAGKIHFPQSLKRR